MSLANMAIPLDSRISINNFHVPTVPLILTTCLLSRGALGIATGKLNSLGNKEAKTGVLLVPNWLKILNST